MIEAVGVMCTKWEKHSRRTDRQINQNQYLLLARDIINEFFGWAKKQPTPTLTEALTQCVIEYVADAHRREECTGKQRQGILIRVRALVHRRWRVHVEVFLTDIVLWVLPATFAHNGTVVYLLTALDCAGCKISPARKSGVEEPCGTYSMLYIRAYTVAWILQDYVRAAGLIYHEFLIIDSHVHVTTTW